MDLNKLLEQAKSIQEDMQKKQKDIEKQEINASSGGEMVKITMNGKGNVTGLQIDESLLKPEEKEILEDLIIAAINNAIKKIEELKGSLTENMMKDMNLNIKDFNL